MFKVFELVNMLREMMKGKKTYIIAFLPAMCIIAEKVLGLDVPYFVSPDNWKEVLWAAAGLSSLRAGVENVIKKTNFNK
jgi:hypothetical protein